MTFIILRMYTSKLTFRLDEDGVSRSKTVRCKCNRGTPGKVRKKFRRSSSWVATKNRRGLVRPTRPLTASFGRAPCAVATISQCASAKSSASSTGAPIERSSATTHSGTKRLNFSPPKCLRMRLCRSTFCVIACNH